MARHKIEGSLAGLIDEKPELEQVVSVIPNDVEREFQTIIDNENVSMSKGVQLAMSLFNAKYRDSKPPKKQNGSVDKKTAAQIMKNFLEDSQSRFDMTGKFIGRVPKPLHDEFQETRKRLGLKMFEATTVATGLLIKYYKENKKTKRSS